MGDERTARIYQRCRIGAILGGMTWPRVKGFLFPTEEVRFPAFATEVERLSVIGLRVVAGVCVAAPLFRYLVLKVLPHVFADDPERLARFQREAKVLASLNHLNIASIYDLEGVDRVQICQ